MIVDLSAGSAIDIYGTAAGMGVIAGGRVVGGDLVGGRLLLGARMVGPGLAEVTVPSGRTLGGLVGEDFDQVLAEVWTGIADRAGISAIRYLPDHVCMADHVAMAWRAHVQLWRAEHAV